MAHPTANSRPPVCSLHIFSRFQFFWPKQKNLRSTSTIWIANSHLHWTLNEGGIVRMYTVTSVTAVTDQRNFVLTFFLTFFPFWILPSTRYIGRKKRFLEAFVTCDQTWDMDQKPCEWVPYPNPNFLHYFHVVLDSWASCSAQISKICHLVLYKLTH